MSEWDVDLLDKIAKPGAIVYPGGNPHSALDIALLHPNLAIAFGVESAHPGFSMTSLIGHSGDTNRTGGNPSLIFLGDCTPDWAGTCDQSANEALSPVGRFDD